jgi:17beta-estradiol 17-dehydrogenase / very-long-chain 3-oxoacyl-CoA reductase
VTGASDGLGKEYAHQLAGKGFNIVLVSRTQSKLQIVSDELAKRYPAVQTKVVSMDVSLNQDSDYDALSKAIDGLDVGILINSVGQSHSIPTPFLIVTKEEMQNIIMINCLATLRITQIVAAGMQQRKRGLILTMGSFGGWAPMPYLSVYSGSKAFLQQWSCALAAELKASNVDVKLCLAYLIVGAMSKVRRPSMLVPPIKPWVRAALSKVGSAGWTSMPDTFIPYWSHALMAWAGETFLGTGSTIMREGNLRVHVDIRNRALRKAAREAKKQ